MNRDDSARKYAWGAAVLLAAVTLLRLWFIQQFELAGDEAYYWTWSKHLDLSYYSKGPGVAWVIACGTALFGDTVLGVRFCSIMLGAGTGWGIFCLGRRLFSSRVGFWSLAVAAVVPLFVIGGLVMTIDPISVFCWTMAALAFYAAKDGDSPLRWALVGLCVGLGMLAKYTNVAELVSFALFCLWSSEHRRRLRRPSFWIMCLVAVACLTPVLVWNARHDWITLTHLQERGALDRAWRFSASEWLQFAGQQLAVVFPPFLLGIFAAVLMPRLRRAMPTQYRFLVSLFLPLFLFYAILGLNDSGEANWTAPSLIGGIVLLAAFWSQVADRSRAARWTAGIALALAGAIALAIPIATTLAFPTGRDPLRRVRGGQSLARQVMELCQSTNVDFIVADHYQTASLLRFYSMDALEVYPVHTPRIVNQYAFWPSYDARHTGRNALFVSRSNYIPEPLLQEFTELIALQEVDTTFKGRPVRHFWMTLCRAYVGPRPE